MMRLEKAKKRGNDAKKKMKGGFHTMQQILVPESANGFLLVKDDRGIDKVMEAANTVIEAMKDLDLTLGECYLFLDLVITALNEKKIKF